MKKTIILEELECAHCAAKMEEAIKKIPGVEDAVMNFMMQKLTLEIADDADMNDILDEMLEAGGFMVTDEDGNEKEYTILFTFPCEETGKSYVLYYDEEDEDGEVFASAYDDSGNLYPVETPQEQEIIEEMFESFMAEEETEEDENEG